MGNGLTVCVRHLRRTALRPDGGGLTDGQLLGHFVARGDEFAFEALVRRHGPMVLGVCRRIVGNVHDAEDSFQATFLLLARKAASLAEGERVGGWLHGVACRAALKAREANARRRRVECQVETMPQPAVAAEVPDDGGRLLDHELDRLPEIYRVPVVLCELEGRSRREVARQLALPEGTLSSRLAKARRLLARRLARHGLLGGGLAALAAGRAAASVPARLVESTVGAAAACPVAGALPAGAAALAGGLARAMTMSRLKLAGLVLTAACVVAGAGGLPTRPVLAEKPAAPARKAVARQKEKKPLGPIVRGWVKSVAEKNSITITVLVKPASKETEEKKFTVAPDAKVILEDSLEKKTEPITGKLADLPEGTGVTLQLSADGKAVVWVSARGPSLHARVKFVDADKGTVAVEVKEDGQLVEKQLKLAKGLRVIKDDGLGKKGDKIKEKEGTLADLVDGTGVVVQLSVDRETALGARILGEVIHCTLKGYDSGTRTLTVTVKEDGQLVDKDLKLAEGARVEGELTPGAPVDVTRSVENKEVVAAVRVRKDD